MYEAGSDITEQLRHTAAQAQRALRCTERFYLFAETRCRLTVNHKVSTRLFLTHSTNYSQCAYGRISMILNLI